jgi:hypothetical protein
MRKIKILAAAVALMVAAGTPARADYLEPAPPPIPEPPLRGVPVDPYAPRVATLPGPVLPPVVAPVPYYYPYPYWRPLAPYYYRPYAGYPRFGYGPFPHHGWGWRGR